MFILAPSNLTNPAALEARSLPKQIFGRATMIFPKGLFARRVYWRMVFDYSLTRYLIALAPFPVAMVIWPHLALPISQAPLLMFLMVWIFESRLLSIPKNQRPALADDDEIGRVLDLLSVRGRALLTRIAADRGIEAGELHFVVEQSEMARVPPLTFVSVQHEADTPQLLDLSADEQERIEETLFEGELTEARLLRVNFAQSTFLRQVVLDPRTISAHARMMALARV
ncbi:MAG: hypothetical protein HKO95_16395 [Rhodobacteraceae bacterium]|nr:hypothetical protein [Alphaproteobacteria bacterium]NNF72182.1 hypothetical protein [Paracoccaceae bacterium]NNK68306.1 hypothetical protein [Paracoccaceae bacterium]